MVTFHIVIYGHVNSVNFLSAYGKPEPVPQRATLFIKLASYKP